MLKNYLLIALKVLRNHKLFALINVAGLAAGLACCLVIALYVHHELSYDLHYQKIDRLYRVYQTGTTVSGDVLKATSTSLLLAPALKQDMNSIEQVARLSELGGKLGTSELSSHEEKLTFADAALLELFEFEWLSGNAATALSDKTGIVLTRALAQKYFGTADAMGRTLLLEGKHSLTVTGVIADLPGNTHLRFTALVPIALMDSVVSIPGMNIQAWNFSMVHTYLLLKPGVNAQEIISQFPAFTERHLPKTQAREGEPPREEEAPREPKPPREGFGMWKVSDLHMQAVDDRNNPQPEGSMQKVMGFSAIGLCILLIAVMNFTNLSTARSSTRAVEVGMRKTIGASRWQLMQQFIGEAMLMSALAMLLALGLVELLLPLLNPVIGMQLNLRYLYSPAALLLLGVMTLLLGLVAGFYPALHLSALRPASTLKGLVSEGRSGLWFRNVLVVVQFTVAIALIVATTVIAGQLRHIRNLDLGFNGSHVLVVTLPPPNVLNITQHWDVLKNRLLGNSDVQAVAQSLTSPLMRSFDFVSAFSRPATAVKKEMNVNMVEPSFFTVYQIKLLAGRYFSDELASDRLLDQGKNPDNKFRGKVIINALAAKDFGWSPQEAVGQSIGFGENAEGGLAEVIGVVDTTVNSVKKASKAVVYWMPQTRAMPFGSGEVAIRISGERTSETLAHIDAAWNQISPQDAIVRHFVDQDIQTFYQQENRQMQLIGWFATQAVILACLGLFGLAAYNTERRRKEIGVRKVMGGSVWSIVLLLTNDFSKLVLIANVVAWPVAYYVMNRWLQGFTYRIDLTPVVFIGSGLIALCIAWVTVGGTAAKAANTKPVLALRYE